MPSKEEAPVEGALDTAPTSKIKRTELTGFHEVKEGEGFRKKSFWGILGSNSFLRQNNRRRIQ